MKKILNSIEDSFCGVILVIMLFLTFINVIACYIFLASMPFVEELTRLGLMILSLVGASVAAKRSAHLGLSVLTDLMPKKVQSILTACADMLGVFFGGVLIRYGYAMVMNEYTNGLRTAGMQWPEWIFGMWVVVGGAVMVIRYVQMIIRRILSEKRKGDAAQ